MEKKCIYCGKIFTSLSKKQLEYNYYAHVGSCKNKQNKEVKHDIATTK